MNNIFDLKTSSNELKSSNDGVSNMQYEQVQPMRDITAGRFSNGVIQLKWQTSGIRWWIPSRSYMRIRCKLTKANGTQLEMKDDIAPNMGLASNLFKTLDFKINNQTVSRVSEFVAQIDALETRLSKSKSWLDSVGSSTNWWQSEQTTRQAQVASDGKLVKAGTNASALSDSRVDLGFDAAGGAGNNRNAAAYTAATGNIVFTQNGGAALPADVREVFPIGSFFAYTSVQGGADGAVNVLMEVIAHVDNVTITVRANVPGDVAAEGRTDFVRVIQPLSEDSRQVDGFELIWQPPLSIFKVGHALPTGDYELLLTPATQDALQRAVVETVGNKDPSQDFKFEVVDLYYYACTVDGPRVDDQTYIIDLEQTRCQAETFTRATNLIQKHYSVSPSTYQLSLAFQALEVGSDTQYSPSKFKMIDNKDLKLERMFISFGGRNLPAPDADPLFKVGDASDYTIQRYYESQTYSGALFDSGGCETIDEWHERGPYYTFLWPRDGSDMSTRANVQYQFSEDPTSESRVFLFDHSRQACVVSIRGGRVQQVEVQDV